MLATREARATDSKRALLTWGIAIVLAHFAVVIWHVVLLVEVQPEFPQLAIVALILANLLPIVGVVAFAKGFSRVAGSLILVPLGVALIIGGYTHFLSPGMDNVLRMPLSELRLPFQSSAVMLALLEAVACWIGLKMFALRTNRSHSRGR